MPAVTSRTPCLPPSLAGMQSEGLNVDDEVLILGAALQMALLCVILKGKAAGGGQT